MCGDYRLKMEDHTLYVKVETLSMEGTGWLGVGGG